MINSPLDDLTATARLQRLSTQLVPSGELNPLLHEILSAAADLSGTDKGNIQFYNPATGRLVSMVEHENVVGVQFHPEKSHRFGFELMRKFAALHHAWSGRA